MKSCCCGWLPLATSFHELHAFQEQITCACPKQMNIETDLPHLGFDFCLIDLMASSAQSVLVDCQPSHSSAGASVLAETAVLYLHLCAFTPNHLEAMLSRLNCQNSIASSAANCQESPSILHPSALFHTGSQLYGLLLLRCIQLTLAHQNALASLSRLLGGASNHFWIDQTSGIMYC